MGNHAPRPKQHLIAAGKLYPGAWRAVDDFRASRGQGLPDWPDWCFIPIAATLAIVADDTGVDAAMLGVTNLERVADAARLAALASWRVTQGVYRFDETLYPCVLDTPLDRELPVELLYRLPEWCVYVETPGRTWMESPLHGFWAHLEFDVNTQRHELRLLLDSEAVLAPVILHLHAGTLLDALESGVKESVRQAVRIGLTRQAAQFVDAKDEIRALAEQLAPLVSLLIYLCTQAAEVGTPDNRPVNPRPTRTKQGWRLFPAQKVKTWEVGVRMGAALRSAYQQRELADVAPEPSDTRQRPHIRRSHWHGFWTGPRDPKRSQERRFSVRWLPPIPVNVDDVAELPVTVRPVK
ncbi:hypothetical protein VRRI112168_02785 [Vreelandella rituensis]|uniref:Uncharacterized protein n=1 Tax=Vreelandella rituensis TaxID=2282306 RepID=A0A368U8Z6_9GAMM|nr:hypothetical protein [Halomonas rituensis]RCV93669.1 hypothetical protein DU506_00500 [Halomonas rituensis]